MRTRVCAECGCEFDELEEEPSLLLCFMCMQKALTSQDDTSEIIDFEGDRNS